MRNFLLLGLLLSATLSPAAQALGLTAVGGVESASVSSSVSSTAPSGTTLPSYSRKLQPTFGAFVDFGVFPFLAFETGGLYLPRKFETQSGGATSDFSETRLQIPLLLRASVPFVSVGAGVYYAYGLGNVRTEASGAATESGYDTAKINRNEAGLLGSVRGSFPLFPLMSAVLDMRYCHGLSNRDTSETLQSYSRDIQVLAGVNIGI